MILHRTELSDTGIFGYLSQDKDELFATLEHSYDKEPKLLPGLYICKRGIHYLKDLKTAFETFEIMNVPGHSGILFHPGNYNEDSEGCILIGTARVGNMVTDSRAAFKRFMAFQDGVQQFNLVVA